MARGRTAQAALAVAPVAELKQIPKPPEHLTKEQGDIWRMVMSSSAGTFIQTEDYPLLAEYCHAVAWSRQIAEKLDACIAFDDDLDQMDKLQKMADRASRLVSSHAVKLKLSPSTRVRHDKAATVAKNHTTRKTWQFEG